MTFQIESATSTVWMRKGMFSLCSLIVHSWQYNYISSPLRNSFNDIEKVTSVFHQTWCGIASKEIIGLPFAVAMLLHIVLLCPANMLSMAVTVSFSSSNDIKIDVALPCPFHNGLKTSPLRPLWEASGPQPKWKQSCWVLLKFHICRIGNLHNWWEYNRTSSNGWFHIQ